MCVAADHEEIAGRGPRLWRRGANDQPRLRQRHRSRGRSRAAARPDVDIFVNVQGDEPELAGASIDLVIELLEDNPRRVDGDAGHADPQPRAMLDDPACVKVVFDARGRALYFSRSPIPHARAVGRRAAGGRSAAFLSARRAVRLSPRVSARDCRKCRRTPLEKLENLEQLRVLEARPRRSSSAWSTSRPSASIRPRITGRLSAGTRSR